MSRPIMPKNITRSEQIRAHSCSWVIALLDDVKILLIFDSIDVRFTGCHLYIVDAHCKPLDRPIHIMSH